jgi:hypothetical protein
MSELLFLVPTRGRPGNARELLEAWEATRTGDSRLRFLIDIDDPCWNEYIAIKLPNWASMRYGPRQPVAELVNVHAVKLAPRHFAIGFMGDDHRPRTKQWDEAMIGVLRQMGAGVIYGNDLFQGENLPTAVAITSNVVRALGWYSPPGLHHMYMDNSWKVLGEGLERIAYLPEIIIEHVHPVAGKTGMDEGYERVNAPEVYSHDKTVFKAWLEGSYMDDIARVNKALLAAQAKG